MSYPVSKWRLKFTSGFQPENAAAKVATLAWFEKRIRYTRMGRCVPLRVYAMTPTARFLLELLAAEIAAELVRESVSAVETIADGARFGAGVSTETQCLLDGEGARGHINRHAPDHETPQALPAAGAREDSAAR
jgi:hypothetical protein